MAMRGSPRWLLAWSSSGACPVTCPYRLGGPPRRGIGPGKGGRTRTWCCRGSAHPSGRTARTPIAYYCYAVGQDRLYGPVRRGQGIQEVIETDRLHAKRNEQKQYNLRNHNLTFSALWRGCFHRLLIGGRHSVFKDYMVHKESVGCKTAIYSVDALRCKVGAIKKIGENI